MSAEDVIAVRFNDDEMARIDALARRRGVERDAAILALVRTGLSACERALEIEGDAQGKAMSHWD